MSPSRFSKHSQNKRPRRPFSRRLDKVRPPREEFTLSPALSDEEKRAVPREAPLPVTAREVAQRHWREVDFVLVTGDPYIDHPAILAAQAARSLEAAGFRVAILARPSTHHANDWTRFGRPRLAFLVTSGQYDSMDGCDPVTHQPLYDWFSPEGKPGARPTRALLAYAQRARDAYPNVPVILFGEEASARRFVHYDFHLNKLKRPILFDARAALLCWHDAPSALVEAARRLDRGEPIKSLRDIPGTVYRIDHTEDLLEETDTLLYLPSYEDACESAEQFGKMVALIEKNSNPAKGVAFLQEYKEDAIVVLPPAKSPAQAPKVTFTGTVQGTAKGVDLPIVRRLDSLVSAPERCAGGCAMCALGTRCGDFGRTLLAEIPEAAEEFRRLAAESAAVTVGELLKTWRPCCASAEARDECRRTSCVWPVVCSSARIRPEAAELLRMTIPTVRQGEVPRLRRFLGSVPDTTLEKIADMISALNAHDLQPERVDSFVPSPFGLVTAMHFLGKDPTTGISVHNVIHIRERRLQQALLEYFDGANYFDVKTALKDAGRSDLIGSGPECLVPAYTAEKNLRRSSEIKRHQRKNQALRDEQARRRQQWEEKNRVSEKKRSSGNKPSFAKGSSGPGRPGRRGTAPGKRPGRPGK